MSKRSPGRPKNNLPAVDRGTPELQARRKMLAGTFPERAEYPLGVLYLHGTIDDNQHRAGVYYAYLYGRIFGKTKIPSAMRAWVATGTNPDEVISRGDEEVAQIWRQVKARFAEAALRSKYGRLMVKAVEDVCVYEKTPTWFKPKPQTPDDQKHAKALCEGLKLLVGIIEKAKQTSSSVLAQTAREYRDVIVELAKR
jgi:hypothetical protein